MPDPLNVYRNGYLATPVVEVCHRYGLFRCVSKRVYRDRDRLARRLGAKPGALTAALDILVAAGLLQTNTKGAFRLTGRSPEEVCDKGLTALYAVEPRELLLREPHAGELDRKIKEIFLAPDGAGDSAYELLQGAIVVPLTFALKDLKPGSFRKELARTETGIGRLTRTIEELFARQGWLKAGTSGLTDAGRRILKADGVHSVVSFRSILASLEDRLFDGNARAFVESPGRTARRSVDAGRFPADECVAEFRRQVMETFGPRPPEPPPRAVVSVEAADGCWLKEVHQILHEYTQNAPDIEQPSIRLIAAADSRRAARETDRALPEIPHDTVVADIGRPDLLDEQLVWNGLQSGQRLLQVRPFTGARMNLGEQQSVEESLAVLAAERPPRYLDRRGRLVDGPAMLDGWRRYFQRLAGGPFQSDFLMLENHERPFQPDISPDISQGPDVSEAFLDGAYRLSHNSLIDAEAFVVLAAGAGLFNRSSVKRYPARGGYCRATLHRLSKRDYLIRYAVENDMPRLCALEELCWQHSRTPEQQILARLQRYPQGQFVLEKAGEVLGVIYSQRIDRVEALDERTAGDVHELHEAGGPIIQLLAINIDPAAQNFGYGDQLLEFMLQRCSLVAGVDRVVGVTLCKHYDADGDEAFEQYIRRRGLDQDPVLAFHQAHGAGIVKSLPDYRPEDRANRGNGVLVSYDILHRPSQMHRLHGECAAGKAGPAAVHTREQVESFLRETVMRLLGDDARTFAADRPVMEMGLDSADLMSLQRHIEEKYHRQLPPAFFFEYNTINKVINHLTVCSPDTPDGGDAGAKSPGVDIPPPDIREGHDGAGTGGKPPDDIAVIGMSCRLPGGITTPQQLWRVLAGDESVVGRYPSARGHWPSSAERPGIDRGGFVEDAAAFDALFFRMAPKDARITDPQQRILLETAWTCLEDAGIVPADLRGGDTGVFVGASNCDYSRLIQDAGLETVAHSAVAGSLAVLPNRISYFFDFCGPSLLIDTACSSSLVAMHTAVQSLRAGECETALIGGVNLICHPDLSVAYHKAGMLAADGRCKVFDAEADGYVRSEGAVMFFLKPLQKAVSDRDNIHAVIKGSAINHGGLAGGLTVPNPQKQSELLATAWRNAGITPADLSYIEAHGTGTSLGDPVEIQGIQSAYAGVAGGAHGDKACAIGSVKSNLGHLESAAGVAGLLKVILSMQHRQLPASINFERLNPKIEIDHSPFYIAAARQPWRADTPRTAGVSSFGSGGANAHVVVAEHVDDTDAAVHVADDDCLFVLSADTPGRLREYVAGVLDWLDDPGDEVAFADVIYTLQVGRTAMRRRLAVTAGNRTDLRDKLQRWLADGADRSDIATDADHAAADRDADAVEKALQAGDLDRLGALWVAGADIDWNRLYGERRPRRISVDIRYPFAREYYWIAPPDKAGRTKTQARGEAEDSTVPNGPAAQTLYFEEYWREQPGVSTGPPAGDAQRVLFVDERFRGEIAVPDDDELFDGAVVVHRADAYRRVADDVYECGFTNTADIRKVFERIDADRPVSILYTWAMAQGEAGIHALFALFRTIKDSATPVAEVTLVGHYDPTSLDACWDYAWVGFQRSLKQSLPDIRISLLYVGPAPCSVHRLWRESSRGGVVWLNGDQKFVLSLRSCDLDAKTAGAVVKQQGGYLITGGCGSLGMQFARHLAEQYQAKLLLLGRRRLDQTIQRQLDDLAGAGAAEVRYHAVDVSDERQMQALGRALPFRIDGVFHIAGCESSGVFHERSTSDINRVLHPKSIGTLLLDEALERHSPDFVCYFSSSSAQLGDFGGCDYAVANRFQTAYGGYREQADRYPGRTVVINWPLWRDGGITVGDTEQTAFYLKSSGQQALESAHGIDIWERIMRSGRTQTLVMQGEPNRLEQLLQRIDRREQSPGSASTKPAAAGGGRRTQYRDRPVSQSVCSDLTRLVSQFMQIPEDRIEATANLTDYGFDSIGLSDFSKQLTAYFEIEIAPIVFFSYNTIQKLSEYISDNYAAHLQHFYRRSAVDNAVNAPGPVTEQPVAGSVRRDERRGRYTGLQEPVAVVGVSGRFPGAADTDQFWRLLEEGKDATTEIPTTRWDWRDYFTAAGEPGKEITTNRGGFIDGVDEFDAMFFEVPPVEAERMDPGERLLLMEAYRAIESAGISPRSLRGTNTGFFVGMEESDYGLNAGTRGITTSGGAMISSRLSYFLDLHGHAVATNTACSSGLVALHQAVASLRQGECDAALVAGINLLLSPAGYLMMSQAGMLSEQGRCHSFSEAADGIGVGEAVVVLMLKPLSAAQIDGDCIYGVVRGSGVNFDGKTNGVTAPNGKMQEALIERVYTGNNIDAGDVSHIVAHGTGTKLGDPVETAALKEAFNKLYGAQQPPPERTSRCAITSCKTNVGHTLAASGLVSVVALLEGMRHHKIPASLNCETENEYLGLQDSPFYINKQTREWAGRDGRPLLGAVSAFGRSGTNAHVVIEEYNAPPPVETRGPAAVPGEYGKVVIPLSARTVEQLHQKVVDLAEFIGANNPPEWRTPAAVDLQSLAYTLQVGRDAMSERLGFIVGSVAQLAEKLQSYLDGRRDIADFREGGPGRNKTIPAMFDDDDLQQIIDQWFDRKKLSRLLDLWVNGVDLNWARLYAGSRPPRIKLPTYPFAGERYWIDEPDSARIPAAGGGIIHPLLHRNTSDLYRLSYAATFTGREFFLRDHRVAGRHVLPGVAYLEMVRAAVEQAVPDRPEPAFVELRDTVWVRPFAADRNDTMTVELFETETADAGRQVDYEVCSEGEDNEDVVHCQGYAVLDTRPAPAKLDLAELRGRMGREVAASELYAAYERAGIDYGHSFRAVTSIRRGEGQLLAHLTLPAGAGPGEHDYQLHPSIMDGALQSLLVLTAADPDQPLLPFELGRLRVISACSRDMVAWVRYTPGRRANNTVITLDVDLCDPEGNVCVQMREFCYRSLSTDTVATDDKRPPQPADREAIAAGSNTFIPVWNPVPAETLSDAKVPASTRVLLLGDDENCIEWVKESFGEADFLHLPVESTIDSIQLALEDRSFDHLLWMAPDVAGNGEPDAGDGGIIEQQQRGVLAVFRIAKALLNLGYADHELQWTLISRNTQYVRRDERVTPTHAGVSGLAGSLAKEYPHWGVRVLDVDSLDSLTAHRCLSLAPDAQGNSYAYRRGEWFCRQLACLVNPPQTPPAYRQRGVYVVIGGAGGLGEVWSRLLIEHYQARIVWIGRRELDATIERKIQSLAGFGDAPVYISADATDPQSLRRALTSIRKIYPAVHGVIHSALVLKDRGVMAMDEARFRDGLSSKVDISVNMVEVFGELDLDFMLFFSSLMSFLKAPGQSNYAAGCTFKDSFAHSLRSRLSGPVKIMNWGYWGDVGVVADDFYAKRMEKAGIGSIDPYEGLQALQTLLGTGIDQAVFYKSLNIQAMADLNVTETIRISDGAANIDAPPLQQPDDPGKAADRRRALESGLLPADMDTLAADILVAGLVSAGLLGGGAAKIADSPSATKPAPYYRRWLDSSIRYLQQHNLLADDLTPVDVKESDGLWNEWRRRRQQLERYPDLTGQLDLWEACLKALPDILAGNLAATDVMFPDSSMHLVEGVYKANAKANYYNDVLGEVLFTYIQQRLQEQRDGKIRILEIGAGTGGTTARLLPVLRCFAGTIAEYCYTDLSKAFLLHAEEHYQPALPALTTTIFDVSKSPAGQSLATAHYDVVIAANVLHATPDVRSALQNAKALLKPQGLLLLNELSTWSLFNHLTFGLLEGWWMYKDPAVRIPGSPALSAGQWRDILIEAGFSGVSYPAADAHSHGQQIIAAVGDGVVRQPARFEQQADAEPRFAAASPHSEPAHVQTAPPAVVSADSLRQSSISFFRELVAKTLKLRADQVDPGEPLEKYGLDSILVVQLTNRVRTVLPDIKSSLFFEVQSVEGLVDHLLEIKREELKQIVPESAPDTRSPDTAAPAVTASAGDTAALQNSAARTRGKSSSSRRGRRRARHMASATAGGRGTVFDVAIVGLSGRYPRSSGLAQFWENLSNGVNCISEVPAERWDWRAYYDPEIGKPGKIYTRWGGFLRHIDKFDPLFFKISPKEAKRMDPQERVFIEACYHAMEDAGYTPGNLGNHEGIGVFAGVMNSRYTRQTGFYSIANRVSYLFDFQGPSMAVDTACSSSLTAVHLALESLYGGQSECAIAGGVNLIIDPVHYQELSELTMLTSGNQCKSFGDAADGFVDAEGVGAVVLKPLAKAEQDGDHIYGVIKGSAINAGGKTNGYTVPNPRAQSTVITKALRRAGLESSDISYVEAHGTGTALGDPIEIAGLTRAFDQSGNGDNRFCAVGSLKSNIGHCESAAGIAGLTKVLLQIKHKKLVPSLHADVTNPEIDFSRTPFRVQKNLADWPRPVRELDGIATEIPRTAGISSFGAGGANAHLIVQEYMAPAATHGTGDNREVIVPLSARTADQLEQKAHDLLAFIRQAGQAGEKIDLQALAYTLQTGREAMEERLGFIVNSVGQLAFNLESYCNGGTNTGNVHRDRVKPNREILSLFKTDSDLQKTVDKWISENKLSKLLELWVKGLDPDWSKLYTDVKPARISLPVYPFARDRYWRDRDDVPAVAPAQADPALHPLVHRNVSDIHQQRYSSTFSGDEPWLSGHQVTVDDVPGQKVIPAMVFVEMARAAVEAATASSHQAEPDHRIVELCDLVWADPVLVTRGGEMSVALFSEGGNRINYEVYSAPQDGAGDVVHCQGRAVLHAQPEQPVGLDIQQLKSQMRKSRLESDSQYNFLSMMGIHYGPAYRGIKVIHLGENQLLAELGRPEHAHNHTETPDGALVLHPGEVDSALQAAFDLIPPAGQPSLPLSLESMRIFSPCVNEMFAWVQYVQGTSVQDDPVRLDIDLCDAQGNVCVQMRGVAYEQAAPAASAEVSGAGSVSAATETPAEPPPVHHAVVSEPERIASPASQKPASISLTAAGGVSPPPGPPRGKPTVRLSETGGADSPEQGDEQ